MDYRTVDSAIAAFLNICGNDVARLREAIRLAGGEDVRVEIKYLEVSRMEKTKKL